ncbi:MAG: response regulator [Thermoanaerobacteraceae bacterium]|nr:response regulator [Thermoanaerobacteraceae bacterium]
MTTILIIDDDADIRYTLREICELSGWQTVEAATGRQGVAKFEQVRPDLVLVDYHMPEMDGILTVKELRRRSRQVPIIVLTVDERQEIADAFLNAGASDFALKPVKAPDLISRLKVHLRLAKVYADNEGEVYTVKGINRATLKLVTDYLKTCSTAVTIGEISQNISLAYPTVHRYLMYLLDQGEVEVEVDYGKVGRPKNKYVLREK